MWSGLFFEDIRIKKWDESSGGQVVDNYTEDGVDYVLVEFDNSPGKKYIYRA